MSFARYLPASAFVPLLILWAGIGEMQKLLVIFIGSVFQIILMVAVAVGNTRRDLVEAAYTLGSSDQGVVRRVLIPANAPEIAEILRLVLGPGEHPELRAAIRRALDMTASLPRLVAMSLHRGATWNAFLRAVAEVDELLHREIERGGHADGSLLGVLETAGIGREELRDQVVTVLAAGHETTAGSLAWALERLAHHPAVQARVRDGDEDYLDAVRREELDVARGLGLDDNPVFAGTRPALEWWHVLLARVFSVNFSLFLLNLIPAFPLDGGRMLQAGLWPRLGYHRSMQISIFTGFVCMERW